LEKPDYTPPAPQSSTQTQNKPKAKEKNRVGDCLDSQYLNYPKNCSSQRRMLSPKTPSRTTAQRCPSLLGIHSLQHPPGDRWWHLFFWKLSTTAVLPNTDPGGRDSAEGCLTALPHPTLQRKPQTRQRGSVSSSGYEGSNPKAEPSRPTAVYSTETVCRRGQERRLLPAQRSTPTFQVPFTESRCFSNSQTLFVHWQWTTPLLPTPSTTQRAHPDTGPRGTDPPFPEQQG